MSGGATDQDVTARSSSRQVRSDRLVTIPNILCAIRLAGSFVLVSVALADEPQNFLWLFVALMSTDWIDGKLAVLLNQRSEFGARLDSWADGALYCALLSGAVWLHHERLLPEFGWIALAAVSYAVSVGTSFYRFGCWPSYHSRMAKTSWMILTAATISFLAEWSAWPLRVAMLSVFLTNLEHVGVTIVSEKPRTDVRSLWSVLASERGSSKSSDSHA